MKLSIYLFRDSVQDFDGLILDKYLDCTDSAYTIVEPRNKLPYECRGYIQANRSSVPRWATYLDDYFEIALENTSSSFILLLKAEQRIFAVTFGYGYCAIDHSKTESQFGLRTALNIVDPNGIRLVDTRNIDLATRQIRTNVSVASPLSEFDINVHLDWVRAITGKPPDGHNSVSSISGSEAVRIESSAPIQTLDGICRELLRSFESDRYRESFAFIDHLQPLARTNPLVAVLDSMATQMVSNRDKDRISIAYPEVPDFERLSQFKIWRARDNSMLPEIDLDAVYGFLDEHDNLPLNMERIYILGLDADDSPVMRKRSLRDYLVCELDYNEQTYILSLGSWYETDRTYARRLQQQVDLIQDVTDQYRMPAMLRGEREDAYNARVAHEKQWLLLDKKLYRPAQSSDRVEICDLLTQDSEFICVKRMTSSATLSHLFSQGSVSATLLKEEPTYQDAIMENAENRWPEWSLAPSPLFVFALPTKKPGPLSESLFFFSKVNLVAHKRAIARLGYRVALCKVDQV